MTPIPETNLEIGTFGTHNNRIIVIRHNRAADPITSTDEIGRVLLIGNPEIPLKRAIQEGKISRVKLDTLLDQHISGHTYTRLYNHIMNS